MKCIVFYAPFINHGEFSKEAKLFAKCHGIPKKDVIPVSTFQPLMLRRWRVLRELKKRQGQEYDAVVFFCHGRKHWLQLVGKEVSIPALGRRLEGIRGKHMFRVILYACKCGLAGGFAEKLAVSLRKDTTITAHTTSGHTTINPYVINYRTYWPIMFNLMTVKQNGNFWFRWMRLLRDEDEDFRFRFAFMSTEQIEKELSRNS